MTSFLVRWSCPFCASTRCGLADRPNENSAMASLNTHLRKQSDETHGEYETFPDDWNEEDAMEYVTVTEVGAPSPR